MSGVSGDMGVCVLCGAGDDGDHVEVTVDGLCEECDKEKTVDGEDKPYSGDEMNDDA